MARALIVGCGCRGREVGSELLRRGWQVRGTSREESGLEAIEKAGIEPALADPDRPGTILDLVGDVAVVVWLLGVAEAEPEVIAAIHGPRLESLMEKLVDTPVRGFAYEAVGSVQSARLEQGREIVQRAGDTWRIPIVFLESPRDAEAWAADTSDALESLFDPR
jgi:hypothetical protein